MCQRLGELRQAFERWAVAFDPALVSAADTARVVDHAAAIEKMAATVKALAAARVAETNLWRDGGDRSPAHHLARKTGSSVGQAAQALESARRMKALPQTEAAARRGELSAQQAAAITDAASADPSVESNLLEQARSSSLQELKDNCARTKAAAQPDPEARRRRIHQGRYLRSYTDEEGAFNVHFRDNPEVGAEIMAAMEPVRDRHWRKARSEGRSDSLEACAGDALVELVTRDATADDGQAEPGVGPGADDGQGPSGFGAKPTKAPAKAPAKAPTKILVRVDLEALFRGYPVQGEVAEIVGFGPVAVSAIADMIATGDPFLVAVATKGEQVVGVAHLGRRPSAHQRSALEWLHPTCAAEGCSAIARLEVDHRLEWAKSRLTLLDLLDRLCGHHHHLKTHEGWALVEGRGKRAFVAPSDRRHPGPATRRQPPPARANGPPAA